jgi:hypothetical protein
MQKRIIILVPLLLSLLRMMAQVPVDLSDFSGKQGATVSIRKQLLTITWPAGRSEKARIVINLQKGRPLFSKISLTNDGLFKEVAGNLDPAFILSVGKRTLEPSSGGWDVFFDKVPARPYQSYRVHIDKKRALVSTRGAHTIVRIADARAATFSGALEITMYNGSPLFDVAAVLSTNLDSTAILYDAGLVSSHPLWNTIAWSDVKNVLQKVPAAFQQPAKDLEVKYRTVIGENNNGSLAVFPAPHQYFYPLDEAFNLKFTWYGNNYRNMVPGFGIGIRQDPLGDKRYVPWFNAPPRTQQRLHFFCLLSTDKAASSLHAVKQFTHNDSYARLRGYKTFQSHFHNEFISRVVLADKPVPEVPEFVDVFKKTGVDIVHLAEFHGPGHPKGPDEERLKELQALFTQCRRLSGKNFLLLPGEEANNFYGGHWLAFFPKPVYWVMSRKPGMSFVSDDNRYGKVYRVNDSNEMLQLLTLEQGLAWTAHARTKSSTGFPDVYKDENFFKSGTFLGAAWKAIPADLSIPTLSKRVLNLLDDMSNWGAKKQVIGECDIFSITNQNEMYAHLNVNYLQLDRLPDYKAGWKPVLDVIRQGKFFVTTGEILLPAFTVNRHRTGETAGVGAAGKATIKLSANWTFPLNFIEIVSGNGKEVYRKRIRMDHTTAFGKKNFTFRADLKNCRWVRLEAWDVAANGAFTQPVWLR